MNSEVTLENVIQAHETRERAFQEYERTKKIPRPAEFQRCKSGHTCMIKSWKIFREKYLPETGQWLKEEEIFQKWSDLNEHSVRLFRLRGIPGEGVLPRILCLCVSSGEITCSTARLSCHL